RRHSRRSPRLPLPRAAIVWPAFVFPMTFGPTSEPSPDTVRCPRSWASLVSREVQRYRSRRLRQGQIDDREVIEALGRAREQQAELALIVERLEALRPSP